VAWRAAAGVNLRLLCIDCRSSFTQEMAGRLRPQTARDDDTDSIASFQSSPSPTKASLRYQTWTGNQQVRLSASATLCSHPAGTVLQCKATVQHGYPMPIPAPLTLCTAQSPVVCDQIDHDNYHKMLEEYRAAKQKQQGDELKIKQ